VVPETGQEMTLVDIPEIVPQLGGGILVVADVAALIVFERGVGVYRRFWRSVKHEEVYLRAYDSVTDARSAFRTVSLDHATDQLVSTGLRQVWWTVSNFGRECVHSPCLTRRKMVLCASEPFAT
jgi:hypothetical protein